MKNNSFGLKEVADVYYFPLKKAANDADLTILNTEGKVRKIDVTQDSDGITVKVGNYYLIYKGKAYANAADAPTAISASLITYQYGFDSLKVSNIEVTSEETTANGGKGNPELISWSYGKAATLTIEDALMNLETCHLIFGTNEGKKKESDGTAINGVVTVDANSFPNNYFVVGDTVVRPFTGGDDEPFVFVIPKAKANTEGTFTMEAEGDPSTFEMTLKCLAQEIITGTNTSAKDVLMQFYKPIANAIPTYYATIAHDATEAVIINAEGILTTDSMLSGSDDFTLGFSTADKISVAIGSEKTVYQGSKYKYAIKANGETTAKAYLEITVE